jgi:hypothetical protein
MFFPANLNLTGIPESRAGKLYEKWQAMTDGQRMAIQVVDAGRKAWRNHAHSTLCQEALKYRENGARLDANETMFFDRFLERISTIIREEKHPTLMAKDVIPQSRDGIALGQKILTKLGFRAVGKSGIMETGLEEMPYVELFGTDQSIRIITLTDAFFFSMLQQASEAIATSNFGVNVNTQERKLRQATRIILTDEDEILSYGKSELQIFGALTLDAAPNTVEEFSVINGDWDATGTTADDIIADVEEMRVKIKIDSNRTLMMTELWLPTKAWGGLNRRLGDTNSSTLSYLQATYPKIKFAEWDRCDEVPGADPPTRAMAMARDVDVLEYHSGPGIEMAPLHHSHPTMWTQQLMLPVGGVSTSNPQGIKYIKNTVAVPAP